MERARPSAPPIDDWANDLALKELSRLAIELPAMTADETWNRIRRLTPKQRGLILSALEDAVGLSTELEPSSPWAGHDCGPREEEPMRARYDSQADALSIDIETVEGWDEAVAIDGPSCNVALAGGRPVNVELLAPVLHMRLLAQVAEQFGLDVELLDAVAWAALAAPDRPVDVAVGGRHARPGGPPE